MGPPPGYALDLVVGRPGFDSLAESNQKKLVFTASLLDIQH